MKSEQMFIFIILTLTCLLADVNEVSAFDLSPGKPLPHADIIEKIIKSQFGNGSGSSGLLNHYLDGDDSATDAEDINVNILDITSFRELINVFKKQYEKNVTDAQTRRNAKLKAERRDLPHAINNTMASLLIPKAFTMMQQSIYATRYRLQDTNFFRNRYKDDTAYNIAILVASMDQIIMKMDNLYREMQELLNTNTHFLWYLIIYEKLLSMNIDVGYMARRIWALHDEYMGSVYGEDPPDEGPDTRPELLSPDGRPGGPPMPGGAGGPPMQGGAGGPPMLGEAGGPPMEGGAGGPPMEGGAGGPPMQGGMGGPPMQGGAGGPPMKGGPPMRKGLPIVGDGLSDYAEG